jgi:GNAT superfamily N-acetyltransferase
MSLTYADDKLVRGSELVELYAEAGWSLLAEREPSRIEQAVRQATVFLTAREGARLVGFASALSDRVAYAHVTEFLVRKGYDAKGVGAELMRRLLAALPEERLVTILAEPDGVAFYRRFDFLPAPGALALRRG